LIEKSLLKKNSIYLQNLDKRDARPDENITLHTQCTAFKIPLKTQSTNKTFLVED